MVQDFQGCLRTVAPAMLVVLSWTYVALANVNMVGYVHGYQIGLAHFINRRGAGEVLWFSEIPDTVVIPPGQ